MKSLLFIGLEFHKKTGSVDFLLDMFRQHFQVTLCLVDVYTEDPYSVFDQVTGEYDVLICFQAMPTRFALEKHFSFKHAAFFPMVDSCPSITKAEKWYLYRNFQIICFSAKLCHQLKSAGFSAHYIQFFPKPANHFSWGDANSAFLWARREEINCRLAESLLSKANLKAMHVHKAPDPGSRFVYPSAASPIEYSYSVWFHQKSDMSKEIERSAYYIAPRQKEGIGMSFLEAMAMARCVVAHDDQTMNEYIEHGRTGLLYSLKKPKALDAHDVEEIQRQAYQYACKGYEEWEKNKYKIIGWLCDPVHISAPRIFLRMLIRFFSNPAKTISALRMNKCCKTFGHSKLQ